MNFNVKTLAAKVALLFFVGNAMATGIPVIDGLNVSQTTITAIENVEQTLKQLEQYQAQLQQYEDQIKNSIAPAAYLWDRANKTMNKVLETIDTLEYYRKQAGNLDLYLAKFKKVGTYRGSECFAKTGCTKEQRAQMNESVTAGSDAQKNANDAMLRGLQSQQEAIKSDADSLVDLQGKAQTATGRMEAIQYANQLASHQSNQLLQLRTLLVAQQAADAARRQSVVDKEAKEQVSSEMLREGSYTASPKTSW